MGTDRLATLPLLPTTVVGSYPQPGWLVDHDALMKAGVPRVRAGGIWRLTGDSLAEGQRDGTILALHDMERAGIDIVGDGEAGRESYSNQFATALDGIDLVRPGNTIGRTGENTPVPRVVGPVRRTRPVVVDAVEFLRAQTERPIKVTLPGPFTMTQQAQNEHYASDADLAMDYAATVKDKPSGYSFLPELEATSADLISIEAAQPGLDPEGLAALPSKRIMLGVIDLNDPTPETPEVVAKRIRAALKVLPADRIVVAPDCGMKYLPRDVAFAKLKAMVEGARTVRAEFGK